MQRHMFSRNMKLFINNSYFYRALFWTRSLCQNLVRGRTPGRESVGQYPNPRKEQSQVLDLDNLN